MGHSVANGGDRRGAAAVGRGPSASLHPNRSTSAGAGRPNVPTGPRADARGSKRGRGRTAPTPRERARHDLPRPPGSRRRRPGHGSGPLRRGRAADRPRLGRDADLREDRRGGGTGAGDAEVARERATRRGAMRADLERTEAATDLAGVAPPTVAG
ncbi:MAG: hypothetical protein AVDCRST_MAG19-549 [uncultured Thermomicrobiales bacterium]|uniref:Uncharacterized protein n=1 Tax=uncultured Thermomicrobiales bacterium TaxID=1645740 RepID=A0A6J4UH81_9BACT|nr:MAG: hypothetical protein AVDCRST_MAG19-549 [uncultured Thermomicrobiales bacterium]